MSATSESDEQQIDSDSFWDPAHCRWISSEYDTTYLEENVYDDSAPWKTLPAPSRAIYDVFVMCERLEQSPPVAFLAIDIFERFISAHVAYLLRCVTRLETTQDGFFRRWSTVRNLTFQQLPLRLISCIQLASKILSGGGGSSRGPVLGAGKARSILAHAGLPYDIKAVIASEFRVFRQLNFKLPLLSTLDAVEMILAEAGSAKIDSLSASDNSVTRWRAVRLAARGTLRLAYAYRPQHAARLGAARLGAARGQAALPIARAAALAAARLARWPRPQAIPPSAKALADLIIADALEE